MTAHIFLERAPEPSDYSPDLVKVIAPHVLGEKAVKDRLLTDQRMVAVWRELRRIKVRPAAISRLKPYQRLRTWEISDAGVSLNEQACAALFAFSAFNFSNSPRTIGTRSQAEALAALDFDAAEVCRRLACEAPPLSPERRALEVAAEFIKNHTRWKLEHLLSSPYTIGDRSSRPDNNDSKGQKLGPGARVEARGRVRALAAETHAIFGQYLYGTVATVATVALQIDPTISKQDVRNWCSDLVH